MKKEYKLCLLSWNKKDKYVQAMKSSPIKISINFKKMK